MPSGPCKEVIRRDNFSLLDLPILQCWPKDAGRFITLPCVITRDPKTGKRNVGMYRMQVYDARTTGMHWQRQKVAAEHYRERLRQSASNDGSAEGAPPKPSFGLAYGSLGHTAGDFPVSERSASQILSLPMYSGLDHKQQRHIADQVIEGACFTRPLRAAKAGHSA